MQIEFHTLGTQADSRLRGEIDSELQVLNELMPITHAHLSLERQHEATPPYQAVATLAVPGPDIHAAARDHTLPAAWRKVAARLREQIEQRRSRHVARKKGRAQPRPPPAARRAK